MRPGTLLWIRRICQTVFLLLFLFLLVESRLPGGPEGTYGGAPLEGQDLRIPEPVGLFFHLDPLVALTSLLGGRTLSAAFLWSGVTLLCTLVLGRVFCGFVCPLGTLFQALGPRRAGAGSPGARPPTPPLRRANVLLLMGVLGAAFLGLNLAGLLDPISLLFRSLALSLFPAMGIGLKEAAEALARNEATLLREIGYQGDRAVSSFLYEGYPAFWGGWFLGFLFLTLLLLNRRWPRFWCRYVCPLGALLAVVSRCSLLRPVWAGETCTRCGLCARACQGAVLNDPEEVGGSTGCLRCFRCLDACPTKALSFRLGLPRSAAADPFLERRAVLGGLLAGVALPFLGALDGQVHRVPDPRVIRPPGTLPEGEFLALCQRCGLCMKVCPTNALHPAILEAGVSGLWTPRLVMTLGYCEVTCTLCGSVCPTGAIRVLTASERSETPVRIGSAYVDRGQCLPWSGNGPCIVCEEHCPTSPKAIRLVGEPVPVGGGQGVTVPLVDLSRCVGCGICENRCPVRGRPAIRVISAGETRSRTNRILLS